MVNATNEKSVWAFLKSKGMSDTGAASVMGNLEQESGFSSSVTNSIGAFGLAQWMGGRKTALDSFAASRGEAPTSLDAQLNYLWKEISSGSYGSVGSLNNMTPAAGAVYFMDSYEKPGDNSGGARAANANAIYRQFTGTNPPYSPDTSSTNQPSSSDSTSATAFPVDSDPITVLDKSLQIKNFQITNPIGSVAQDAGAIGLRVVLTILGLAAIVFALYATVKNA